MRTKEVRSGVKKRVESHDTMVHELKSDYDCFLAVLRDEKLAEIRINDREFEAGDYIFLRQTTWTGGEMNKYAKSSINAEKNKPLIYTGRTELLIITHVQSGFGLLNGYVVLSFRKLK